MKKRKKTERLPLWGMLLTTLLVLGGLYAFHWWTEARAAIYEQRAREAVERGDWAQAASLGEKAEAAGAEDTVNELTYQNAVALFEAGNYEEARDLFAGLGAYEDAPRLVLGCAYKRTPWAMRTLSFGPTAAATPWRRKVWKPGTSRPPSGSFWTWAATGTPPGGPGPSP